MLLNRRRQMAVSAFPSDLLTIPTIIRETITTAVPITTTVTAITTTSRVTTTIIPGGTLATIIGMMIRPEPE